MISPFLKSLVEKLVSQILLVVWVSLLGLLLWKDPVLAASNSNLSNQDMNQPAMLIAPEPSFEINIYSKPNQNSRRIGYGLGGTPVTILEQVGSNEGLTWDYIRLENTASTAGWVPETYVSMVANPQNNNRNPPARIPRQPQQSYRQQNQNQH